MIETVGIDPLLMHELRDAGVAFAVRCYVQTPTLWRMLHELDDYAPPHELVDELEAAIASTGYSPPPLTFDAR